MVDVGAGSGEVTQHAFTCFSESLSAMHKTCATSLTIIESDEAMLQIIAGQPILDCASRNGPAVTLLPMTFQRAYEIYPEFCGPADFILASHVFYYLCPWQDALASMFGLLAEGGLLCIALRSRINCLHDFRREITAKFANLSSPAYLCAEDIEVSETKGRQMGDVQTIDYDISIPRRYCDHYHIAPIVRLFCMLLSLDFTKWDARCDDFLLSYFDRHEQQNGSLHLGYSERVMWFRT